MPYNAYDKGEAEKNASRKLEKIALVLAYSLKNQYLVRKKEKEADSDRFNIAAELNGRYETVFEGFNGSSTRGFLERLIIRANNQLAGEVERILKSEKIPYSSFKIGSGEVVCFAEIPTGRQKSKDYSAEDLQYICDNLNLKEVAVEVDNGANKTAQKKRTAKSYKKVKGTADDPEFLKRIEALGPINRTEEALFALGLREILRERKEE